MIENHLQSQQSGSDLNDKNIDQALSGGLLNSREVDFSSKKINFAKMEPTFK